MQSPWKTCKNTWLLQTIHQFSFEINSAIWIDTDFMPTKAVATPIAADFRERDWVHPWKVTRSSQGNKLHTANLHSESPVIWIPNLFDVRWLVQCSGCMTYRLCLWSPNCSKSQFVLLLVFFLLWVVKVLNTFDLQLIETSLRAAFHVPLLCIFRRSWFHWWCETCDKQAQTAEIHKDLNP